MVSAKDVLDKITTRNFMAISFTSIFLYAVVMTVNLEAGLVASLLDRVQDMSPTEAIAIGTIGGGIGGVFFKMVSDMVQFYFRASGKKTNGAP